MRIAHCRSAENHPIDSLLKPSHDLKTAKSKKSKKSENQNYSGCGACVVGWLRWLLVPLSVKGRFAVARF
jgi:hypothetical protein